MKKLLCMLLALLLCMGTAFAYEDLPFGSKGEEVKQMQTRLKKLGFYEKSIDGDFGNLSKTALKAFQAVNGLEQTGEATAEVLELLYSEEAKSAPMPPDVEVTGVKFNSKNGQMKVSLTNNLDEDVVYVQIQYMSLKSNGEIWFLYGDIDMNEEMHFYRRDIDQRIKANKTVSLSGYWDIYPPVLAVGVSAYHTASGKKVLLAREQMTYLTSANEVIYPLRDPQNYVVLSDEEYERSHEIKFGYSARNIPYFTTTKYMLPAGDYIAEVSKAGMAETGGLMVGDVVTAIDGVPATEPYYAELAKLKMLDGETVTVTYWRNNQSHETTFSLHMEAPAEEEAKESVVSIADELLKYAELLERGLITQEEFELFKEKLMSE